MMDVPGCCGRRPCCDNGIGDICQGVNCIVGGVTKGLCCGLNMLGNLGCALIQPCAPACPPPRPCCCRPRPHPPTCTCRCVCRCDRVCDDRRCC